VQGPVVGVEVRVELLTAAGLWSRRRTLARTYTGGVSGVSVAPRPRSFVRVSGPDAEDFLQRMVSNDVAALAEGESCEALLLTAKARVIAPLRVLRRAPDDFLLLTEPELGERVRAQLIRSRIAAKAEIELEEHRSTLVFGARPDGAVANEDYGRDAWEVLDAEIAGQRLGEEELDRLRIAARRPRFGREIDERVLPAEAGLVERAVSFSKGCYPGQEPITRLHRRGHVNRSLRVLELDNGFVPELESEIRDGDKVVGRVTSAVPGLALAYVRVEVPNDAELSIDGTKARLH
jgi:tRNA-modifying protein YgfZ